jgi:hypothetical protein
MGLAVIGATGAIASTEAWTGRAAGAILVVIWAACDVAERAVVVDGCVGDVIIEDESQ